MSGQAARTARHEKFATASTTSQWRSEAIVSHVPPLCGDASGHSTATGGRSTSPGRQWIAEGDRYVASIAPVLPLLPFTCVLSISSRIHFVIPLTPRPSPLFFVITSLVSVCVYGCVYSHFLCVCVYHHLFRVFRHRLWVPACVRVLVCVRMMLCAWLRVCVSNDASGERLYTGPLRVGTTVTNAAIVTAIVATRMRAHVCVLACIATYSSSSHHVSHH